MPIISVIIPVYNVEKYLARCLDSILNQTFTDFEAICINDGSKDASLAILHEYAQKDARIIVLDQENQGQSIARNRGLDIAQGEYILFVDSDDAIERQLMEIAHHVIVESSTDIVLWDTIRIDADTKVNTTFKQNDISKTNISVRDLFKEKTVSTIIRSVVWIQLFKKSFIQDIRFMPHIYHEDEDFIYTILLKDPKITYINIPLTLHTFNINSTMGQQTTLKHITSLHKVIKHLHFLYNEQPIEIFSDYMNNIQIPMYIDVQRKRITYVPTKDQLPLWMAFEEELQDLKKHNILPPCTNRTKESLTYEYILQHGAEAYYKNKILSWRKKPFHVQQTNHTKTYYIFGIKLYITEKLGAKKRALHILGMTFTYTKK